MKSVTEHIESKMENMDKSSVRWQVLETARAFKTNWIEFAKKLYMVKRDKFFKEWGYISLDTYCSKEIGIKKQTAFKLINSYYFLKQEEPRFVEDEAIKDTAPKSLPDYEAINILRRAKANKDINENDYDRLKQEVLEKGSEPREVGKQFRSMLWAIKAKNPEEEKRNRKIMNIKRLISTLKNLKKEAELLKLLPDKFIRDTDKLIASLEPELEQLSHEK